MAKSVVLFVLAAIAEIGVAYLVWIGLRDGRGALSSRSPSGPASTSRR